MKPRFTRRALATFLPLVFGTYTQAQTFNTANDGGNWGTAGNWNTPASVPNAIDAEAIVNGAGPSGTLPATTALDVFLDGNFTIGKLTRSVTAGVAATFPTTAPGFDITKGLTLQKTSGTPEINVLGDVFFYSAIFGTQGLEKTNTGRFTFRFNPIDQTYTGPVKISGGTVGIQKDRSLGDVNNDIEITPTAAVDSTLFAEPSDNAAITLPATRTITLNDPDNSDLFDPCLRIDSTAFNFTVDGDIGEVASSGCFLKKTGAGVVVLNGTNSWTGGTLVSAGVLTATKPAALPSFDTLPKGVYGTATLAVRYGDAWTWTDPNITSLIGSTTFDGTTSAFGIDTTGNVGDTICGLDLPVIGIDRFTKVGPGKLTLSSAPGLSRINVFEGTLALGVASVPASGVTLAFTKSGSILDLGTTTADASALNHVNGGTTTISNGTLTMPATYSFAPTAANTVMSLPTTTATFGRVVPFSGATTTINGTGGSLTVNGDFNFDVNGLDTTRLVMSGLGSFTYDRPTRAFRVLPIISATTANNECLLAATGSGTNVINALSVGIGGASGASGGTAFQGQLRLGVSNTFNTPNFTLGGFNGSGLVTYQAGLTTPSFKLRGADGTSPATSLVVGETSSGVRSGAGTLDLSTGSADILASGIWIGRHIAGATNATTNTLTVPAGTLTADFMILSEKVNSGTPALTGVVNQQGSSTVTVNSLTLAQTGFGTAATGQVLQATYNLDGGTLAATSVNGFYNQVESAAAAGTITTAGSLSVTVTGADLVSPVTVNVPVASGDVPTGTGATSWTQKVLNALNGNATIAAKFVVSRADNAIGLTRRTGGSVDTTLNIALANGTAAGITAVTTSTDAVVSRNTSTGIGRNLILKGGTLINKAGADLAISGVTVTVSGVTTTVVDSTPAQAVNFTDVAFSTRINSATPSAGTLQVDGDVVLTTSTLTVFDDAPTNAVAVAPGTKLVLIDYQDGSLTGTFTGIADGDTVNVTKGLVTNAFVLDYNDPAYGGKAVTLTIPGSANNYASWATDNGITGQPFDEDFDNDGLDNGVEYALGKNPTVSDTPAGVVSNGGLTTTFTKGTDAKANGDVTWDIETSTDLGIADNWEVNNTLVSETADQISITFTPGTPVKNFARLKVVKVP